MTDKTTSISDFYVNVAELQPYIARNGLEAGKTSRQLADDLGRVFQGFVSIKTLLLAALFSGFSVVPDDARAGLFRFVKL